MDGPDLNAMFARIDEVRTMTLAGIKEQPPAPRPKPQLRLITEIGLEATV